MAKKILFLIAGVVVLVLAGAGFFYWQKNQADVRELNKTLPAGVKVAKSLIGNEYTVVNKIDGYEFRVPPEWKGLKEIAYDIERTEQGYTASSVGLEGNEGDDRIAGIDRYKINESSSDLGNWAKNNFETFGLIGDFQEDRVGEFEIVKTREEVHLVGMAVYFFKKDSAVYALTGGSEEFLRYIITNGKW